MKHFEKVKTAVIGAGQISNIYLRNLKELFSIIDLVAVANRTPEKAKEKAETYHVDRVMTIDEVMADPEIELVVVLTGADSHYDLIKRALLAGKHVYTEKIFTTDIEKTRELCALAREKTLLIGVAPDTVLGAGIQTARRVIDLGLVGNITSGVVNVTRNQGLSSEFATFLQNEGGSLPYDVGPYYIGALVALLGPVKRVTGMGAPSLPHERQKLFTNEKKDSWIIPGNNLIAGAVEFESGAIISVHFTGNTVCKEHRMFELYGTKGILHLGDPNCFDGEVGLELPESDPVNFPFTHGYDGHNTLDVKSPYDNYGHRGVGVAELAYSIRQNRTNRLSMDYGLHVQEVLVGFDESIATGQTYEMKSRAGVRPLRDGYYSSMMKTNRADAEISLID